MSVVPQSKETALVQEACPIEVSIIVPTCDRPDSLHRCLTHLVAQETVQRCEIIVIDNKPQADSAASVIAEFPNVILLEEARAGASYARNTGILHSQGEFLVTVDDDVVVPPGWLEKLLTPFERDDVAIVTGDLRPLSLDQETERLFETYCGLGRGNEPFEIDGEWFHQSRQAIRAWEFGVTANSAYRSEIFRDPAVGLLEETLGPGSPVGCGEDPYLFYRMLQAGYRLLYCPEAYAWHEHRQTREALIRQIYQYSKSASAYHLTTLIKDKDRRAIRELTFNLPFYYLKRFLLSALRLTDYPTDLAYTELIGYWAGPWSLWRSYQRVKKLGRSLTSAS